LISARPTPLFTVEFLGLARTPPGPSSALIYKGPKVQIVVK
jgi:hypothetical protein